MMSQVVTGRYEPNSERVALGRPDHNVHAYAVIESDGAGISVVISPAISGGSGSQGVSWRLAGINEPGELWLSGPRLARGYRGRPDITAAAFVSNPFVAPATDGLPESLKPFYERAYRTGDLVRWAPDGQVRFQFM